MRDKLLSISQIRFIRYLFAAGTATVVDNAVFVVMMYLLAGKIASPEVLRFISVVSGYSIGLMTNFWLSKIFVFQESELRLRTQFLRFTIVALLVLVVRIGMVELLYNYVDLSVALKPAIRDVLFIGTASVFTAVVSFTIHKFFSFRV